MIGVDGFYPGKSDEQLCDEIARMQKIVEKYQQLISWRKTVLSNRMRADGVVRMKTENGSRAEFLAPLGVTPRERRRDRMRSPYLRVKGGG